MVSMFFVPLLCIGISANDPPAVQTWVPQDAMAAYWVRPSNEVRTTGPSSAQQMATWMVTLKAMGVIPREGRALADIMGTLPMIGQRAHAMVLLDISAKPLPPDSYRLDTMQSALVIDSRGIEVEIDRRLRDLLGTYTDAETGKIEKLNSGELTYHRLTDSRLPPWAVIEWAKLDNIFLVGFGEQAFPKMLDVLQHRSPSLADDAWFKKAHERCRGATSGLEVYVDLKRLRTRLGEIIQHRVGTVMQALALEKAERLLWTVGFDGRALWSEALGREGDQDHHVILAGPEIIAPEVAASLPPAATGYAAFRFPLRIAIERACDGYLNSRSQGGRERIAQAWEQLSKENEFDVTSGLLEPLGDHLIVHSFPLHPLRVPGLWTFWFQYRGDKAIVAQTIERMMSGLAKVMNAAPESQPTTDRARPKRFELSPKLMRDPDGIWYLQLGLIGPAVGIADNWIVISFSPQAVRENLLYIKNIK